MSFYGYLLYTEIIKAVETTTITKETNSTTLEIVPPVVTFTTTTEVNHYTISRERITDTTIHNVGGSGKLGLGLYWGASISDTTYTYVHFQEITESGGTFYDLVTCDNTNFPTANWAESNKRFITFALCPNETTYKLQGNKDSTNFKILNLFLAKCTSGSCQTDVNMQSDIDKAVVELNIMTGFYDYDANPATPINDINNMESFYTQWGFKLTMVLYVKENRVKYLNGTTENFYSISSKLQYNEPNTSDLFDLVFMLDSEIDVYEQYELTQPDSIRRNLDTNTTSNYTYSSVKVEEKDDMGSTQFYLFLLTQIGGLYMFCYILLNCLTSG